MNDMTYVKPAMVVIEIEVEDAILAASGGGFSPGGNFGSFSAATTHSGDF